MFKATRKEFSKATQLRDGRSFKYLKNYFGANTRIDKITPLKAAGIRGWMSEKDYSTATINRSVTMFKMIFRFAVDTDILQSNPFSKVKGGATTNSKRQYYVSYSELESAIQVCENEIEFAGALAFARYAGLRIPSEIRDLKFSDFKFLENNFGKEGIFSVPVTGKTGKRTIPFFLELQPYFLALYNTRKPDQEFVFEKYRNSNIAALIRKKMKQNGLPIWVKFFTNLRSSCITDKEHLGWQRSYMDAAFGNSESVRLGHYYQPLSDVEYAALGQQNKKQSKQSVPNNDGNNTIKIDTLTELMQLVSDIRGRYGNKTFDVFEMISAFSESISEEEVKITREVLNVRCEDEIIALMPALVTENVTLASKLLPKIIEKYPQEVQPFLNKALENMPNINELMTIANNVISNSCDVTDMLKNFAVCENSDVKKSGSVTNTEPDILGGTRFEPVTSAV
ncbi:MAG: phage integrase SAM-like domain-containing protein [Planctomycetaceae bacterium]|nr:phage integrase SAM-like domain-containing protein [Planctomycetaceae bacterium]